MRKIRSRVSGALGVLAFVFLAAPPPAAHAGEAEDAAADFVMQTARDAVRDLTDPEAGRAERTRRMTVLLNERFAGEKIARWILGRHWKKASEAQRARYLDLYTRLMAATYVGRFDHYAGEKLALIKAVRHDEKDIIVKTRLNRPAGGLMIKIDWRVRGAGPDPDADPRVLDLMVEGVSMAVAQRAEFSAALRRADNDLNTFLDGLEGRLVTMTAAAGESAN